jgi:transcriptional regulator with XRE-family HTH domain
MYIAGNLKILRKRRRFTQDTVADSINIKRSTYNGYENSVSYPSLQSLIKLSEFFRISTDALLKTDMTKLGERELLMLEAGSEVFVQGNNLRILTHTVNNDNEENVELVNLKAKAGYTSGFADPDFLKVLPVFQLPFLSRDRKYRAFQISGDSMEPIPHGSYVVGEFVQNWFSLKDGDACIILTLNDGIVFKCVENKLRNMKKLGLYSLNPTYNPYNLDASDIKEIWKFVHYISDKMPEQSLTDISIHKELANIKKDVKTLINNLEQNSKD